MPTFMFNYILLASLLISLAVTFPQGFENNSRSVTTARMTRPPIKLPLFRKPPYKTPAPKPASKKPQAVRATDKGNDDHLKAFGDKAKEALKEQATPENFVELGKKLPTLSDSLKSNDLIDFNFDPWMNFR